MRYRPILLLLLLSMLPLGGCHSGLDSELSVLERRIEKLEQRCKDMNATLEGLRAIVSTLESYDFLQKVESFSENGRSGYILYFTHSSPVTLYNGTDAETPVLGVAKGEDGVWYWTVKYPSQSEATFITDNYGVRIATSAATPILKIENGYWMVSYDNGEVWHELGKATGEDGASFFDSVVNMGSYVQLNMINGTTIQVPTWESYEKLKDACTKANQNLEAFIQLREQLDEKTYVRDLVPILNGKDTIGCRLYLSNDNSYAFYNGTGTNAPVIGAAQDTANPEDKAWYWTIRFDDNPSQWILDEDGHKIQANAQPGLTAKLSLLRDDKDGLYYWAVAYGDGEPEFLLVGGKKVAANVAVPSPVVLSIVSVGDDQVSISLSGGQTILIPLARPIIVTLGEPVVDNILTMAAKDTVSFICHLESGDERAEIVPLATDGFFATARTVDYQDWTIRVIAPDTFAEPATSRLNLLVSDGYGSMKTIVLTILPKKEGGIE